MQLEGIIISIAAILLVGVLLFLYFRHRIQACEQKLDVLFKLIESHASENTSNHNQSTHEENDDKIYVSDGVVSSSDEEDDDINSTISLSDNDDETKKNILFNSQNLVDLVGGGLLNVTGDIFTNANQLENESENNDSISIISDLSSVYSENDKCNNNECSNDACITVEKKNDTVQNEFNESLDTQKSSEIKDVLINYSKLTVAELKNIARKETTASGVGKMKKEELINLLSNQ